MILGVAGVVALGAIALYQTWAARNYRAAALLYDRLCLATSRRDEANRRRVFAVGEALQRARRAVVRGDPAAALRVLEEATREVEGARLDDEALVTELQAIDADRPVRRRGRAAS